MAVYVDEPIWEWRGRRWCHLTADSADELHEMAARLGLVRQWFQSKPERPWHDHYDIPEEVRTQAIACGAQPLGTGEMGRRQASRRDASAGRVRARVPTTMTEKMIPAGGAEICTEAFGDPGDPPILMIMGQMASMLWWPAEFCERLAKAGRLVIRYDNRDTGRSTGYEPGQPAYTLDDLADDAVAVLDGYGIERAHLVAMSMGGVIAQIIALKQPQRVAGVTAISTSALDGPGPDLPGTDPEYLEHAAAFADLDWSDTQALAELLVRDARQIAGSRHPFDEAAARELVTRDLERTTNPASLMNHGELTGGEQWQGKLGEIDVPFLVIHGTDDPLLPHAHGVALANAVPGARLVTLEGGGHELNEGDWDQILDAIVATTRS